MAFGRAVTDKELLKSVNRKLMQRATGAGTKVQATVSSGVVTLSGVIGTEYQRRPLVNSMTGTMGVKRIIDTLTLAPPRQRG